MLMKPQRKNPKHLFKITVEGKVTSSSSNRLGKEMAKPGFFPPLEEPILPSFVSYFFMLTEGNEG